MRTSKGALKFEGIKDTLQRRFLLNWAFLKAHKSKEKIPNKGHSRKENVAYDRTCHVITWQACYGMHKQFHIIGGLREGFWGVETEGTECGRGSRNPHQGERRCLRLLQRKAARALLQIAAQRGTHKVHHPSTHVLSPLLFIYTLRGWRESRHNSWPTPFSTLQRGGSREHPCQVPDVWQGPKGCWWLWRWNRKLFWGRKTGSAEVCWMKDKWLQKSRGWWDGVESDTSGFQSQRGSFLTMWPLTNHFLNLSLNFFSSCPF